MTYSSVRLIEKLLQLIQKHTVRKKKKKSGKGTGNFLPEYYSLSFMDISLNPNKQCNA